MKKSFERPQRGYRAKDSTPSSFRGKDRPRREEARSDRGEKAERREEGGFSARSSHSASKFGRDRSARREEGGFSGRPQRAGSKFSRDRSEHREEGGFSGRPQRAGSKFSRDRSEHREEGSFPAHRSGRPASKFGRDRSERREEGSFPAHRSGRPGSKFSRDRSEHREEGSFPAHRSGRPGSKFGRDRSEHREEGSFPAHRSGRPGSKFGRGRPERHERDENRRPSEASSRRMPPRSSKPTTFEPKRQDKPQRNAPPVKTYEPREGVIIWGVHAVREAWLNADRQCFNLWVSASGLEALEKTMAEAGERQLSRPDPKIIERPEFDRLLPQGSVHQGVALEVAPLAEVSLTDFLQSESLPDLIVVLDQVTDPHNVGAILRSAAAFGAGALIMTERNAPSTTGVMAKTACGAAEHVPQIQVVNLSRAMTELQQAGYWCVGLAEEAVRDMSTLDLSGRTAIVLGAEGDGLRRLTRESCDELARLPTGGPIGSLNVSNAAAVALYEVKRQRTKFKE